MTIKVTKSDGHYDYIYKVYSYSVIEDIENDSKKLMVLKTDNYGLTYRKYKKYPYETKLIIEEI